MIEMSSTARTFVGSAIATIRVSSLDERDRNRAVALRGLVRDQVDGAQVELEDAQVDVVEAEALGGRAGKLVGGDHPFVRAAPARASRPLVARLGDREVDPLAGREAELDQMWSVMKRPEPPRRLGGVRPGRSWRADWRRGRTSAGRRRSSRRSLEDPIPFAAPPAPWGTSTGRRTGGSVVSLMFRSVRHFSSPRAAPPAQSRARKLAAPWWTSTSNPSDAHEATRERCSLERCAVVVGRRGPPRFADHAVHRPKAAASLKAASQVVFCGFTVSACPPTWRSRAGRRPAVRPLDGYEQRSGVLGMRARVCDQLPGALGRPVPDLHPRRACRAAARRRRARAAPPAPSTSARMPPAHRAHARAERCEEARHVGVVGLDPARPRSAACWRRRRRLQLRLHGRPARARAACAGSSRWRRRSRGRAARARSSRTAPGSTGSSS